MYVEAFGLTAEPFAPTPDPKYFYLTAQHRDARAAIEYGLRERRGFASLVGDVGTGKTTILYSLLMEFAAEINTAYLSHTTLPFPDLLRAVLEDLDLPSPGATKAEMIGRLQQFLREQSRKGRITALIVDEAQNLSPETLEELRLLTNFETFEHKLLQIVLVGQPELDTRLAAVSARAVRERITVRARLSPLDSAQTGGYVAHRLAVAGGDPSLFSEGALREVARISRGNPRRINMLCHQALLAAYAREERTVTQDTIRSAAGELEIAPPRRAERLALLGAGAGKMLGASKGLAGMALDLVRDRWPRLRFPTRRFPTLQLPIPSRTTAAAAGLAVVVLAGVLFFGSGPSRPPAEPAADVPLAPVDREESSLHALFASVGRSLSAVVDGLIPADGYLAERGRGRR